jgi:hypothetical protein
MRKLFVITALLGASAIASADVWRWVDGQGRVHYSDRPVEGAVLVKTTTPRPSTPATAADNREAARAQLAAATQQIDAAQSERQATQAVRQDLDSARDKQCKDARERYDKAILARRIYKTGENGERVYLPDAEADKVRVEYRQDMDAACGPRA